MIKPYTKEQAIIECYKTWKLVDEQKISKRDATTQLGFSHLHANCDCAFCKYDDYEAKVQGDADIRIGCTHCPGKGYWTGDNGECMGKGSQYLKTFTYFNPNNKPMIEMIEMIAKDSGVILPVNET